MKKACALDVKQYALFLVVIELKDFLLWFPATISHMSVEKLQLPAILHLYYSYTTFYLDLANCFSFCAGFCKPNGK